MRLAIGLQWVREAILAGAAERVLVEARPREAQQIEALARFARDRGLPVDAVPRAELDRRTEGDRHQGAVAIVRPLRLASVPDLVADLEAAPLLVALDEITDPHNLGAIVRSAVAFGARGVIFPEDKSAPLSSAMGRASAGAIEHAHLCRVPSLPRALDDLAQAGVAVFGLDAVADRELAEVDLRVATCLVVGSEGKGLRRATKKACTESVRLPMPGPLASLNASVAAGIALYEVVRQRRAQ